MHFIFTALPDTLPLQPQLQCLVQRGFRIVSHVLSQLVVPRLLQEQWLQPQIQAQHTANPIMLKVLARHAMQDITAAHLDRQIVLKRNVRLDLILMQDGIHACNALQENTIQLEELRQHRA
jgi:hypothetical protein